MPLFEDRTSSSKSVPVARSLQEAEYVTVYSIVLSGIMARQLVRLTGQASLSNKLAYNVGLGTVLLRVHLDETTKQVVPYAMENVTPEIHHTIRTFSAYDIPPLDNPVYVLKAYAERPGSGSAIVFRSTEASCRQSPSRSRRPKNEDLTFSSDPRVKRNIAPESYSEVFSMPHHQPAGYPTVSVYMMVDGAQRMIDFVTDVLDGEVIMRIDRDDSSLTHGSLRIGDSVIMLADATKDFPTFPVWLHVYVPDVDATYRRALEKGATSVQEPSEKGDGDRRAGVKDPAGNTWWIATHVGR